jgi:putative ABC transport system permease protein
MDWFRRLWRKQNLERQLDSELRFHFERRVADNRQRGMSEDDARRAARLELGGLDEAKEACRDARGTAWVDTTIQDLRFAARTLRKNPGYAVAAILTLALGIGANTAIFSVIDGVVLRPLAYPEPQRLVALDEPTEPLPVDRSFAYQDFVDCARQAHSFAAIAAWRNLGASLTSPGAPEYVNRREVSASYFSVLGVRMALGRGFLPAENQIGAPPVAILSDSMWRNRFGASPRAIGARLVLGGVGYTVVGVLPPDFRFFGNRKIYTPIGQDGDVSMMARAAHPGIYGIARLKNGVTASQAGAELRLIASRLAKQYPATDAGRTFGIEPLKQAVIGDAGATLYLLAGAVALVLLIACANVANLVLARSVSRGREFAIRAALGASGGRVLRQVITEGLLLGLAGGAAGIAAAWLGMRVILRYLPDALPRANGVALDGRVLLFTLAVSLLTGLVFGLAPRIRAAARLDTTLREASRGNTSPFRGVQHGLVAAEVALAVVLLVGSGLMLRTIAGLWAVNPGFDISNLTVMEVGLAPDVTSEAARVLPAWQQMIRDVEAVPGVEGAALNTILPLRGDDNAIGYWTTPQPPPVDKMPQAMLYTPTVDYFRTMRIRLLAGRLFDTHDTVHSQPVAIVDQLLARRAFPGENPIGREITLRGLAKARVVGIVAHVKHWGLGEDPHHDATEELYFPFEQIPTMSMPTLAVRGMALVIRTSVSPLAVLDRLKQSVLGPGGDQPAHDVETMDEIVADSLARRRLFLMLLGVFASAALLLAAMGIYGVVSYSIGRRTQEIGIRSALGATTRQILGLLMRQGMTMVLAGVAAGALASLGLMRLMRSMLFGVGPGDPLTMAVVLAALCGIGALAIYIPARRGARVDPTTALRYE